MLFELHFTGPSQIRFPQERKERLGKGEWKGEGGNEILALLLY